MLGPIARGGFRNVKRRCSCSVVSNFTSATP